MQTRPNVHSNSDRRVMGIFGALTLAGSFRSSEYSPTFDSILRIASIIGYSGFILYHVYNRWLENGYIESLYDGLVEHGYIRSEIKDSNDALINHLNNHCK